MAKKALGALLLAALPLSAMLVSCSDSSAAEGENPEKVGSPSKMETSAPLPPVPSDAELQQSTDSDSDSSLTESTGNPSPRSTTPPSTGTVEDPYLPPQAYIPPPSPSSNPATPTSTASMPSTTTATTETTEAESDRVSSPKPSKPVPLLPEDNAEKPKDGLPQGGGSAAGEPKPPSAEAKPQSGTEALAPPEISQKVPTNEPTPSKDQASSKEKATPGSNEISNRKISPAPEEPNDSGVLERISNTDEN